MSDSVKNDGSWRGVLPKIFEACVCPETEASRYSLCHPFIEGEYVGATDGRICVRMKKPDGIENHLPTPGTKPPLLAQVYVGEFGDPVDIPKFESLPNTAQCQRCSWHGGCICVKCESEHDCGWCDGTGMVERGPFSIDMGGGRYLNDKYLTRLLACGVTQLCPPVGRKTEMAPWRFTIGGCEGLLMPMRGTNAQGGV